MNKTKSSPKQRWNAQRQLKTSNQSLTRSTVHFPSYLRIFDRFLQDFSTNYAGDQVDVTRVLPNSFPLRQPVWHLCNTVNKFAMDKKCAQLWQRLSAALKPQISTDSFKRWFSAVEVDRGQRQNAHSSRSKQYLSALDRE